MEPPKHTCNRDSANANVIELSRNFKSRKRTISKRKLISEIMVRVVIYYRAPVLEDTQLDMYVEDLIDLEIDEITEAIKIYRMDPRNSEPPLPAQLKALLKPSDEIQAVDAVSRIFQALGKYGDSAKHTEKAKKLIGELGWFIVERFGGWSRITRLSYDELGPMAQEQWRELAVTLLTKHRLGLLEEAPKFPETKKAELIHMGDIIGRLGEKKETTAT
jgi:hypothetical protein